MRGIYRSIKTNNLSNVRQRYDVTLYYIIGLFNGAIQQSGSAVNTWAMSYKPRELAFKLGEKLDIETSDSAELVTKLAEFTPKELIMASEELMKTEVYCIRYQ